MEPFFCSPGLKSRIELVLELPKMNIWTAFWAYMLGLAENLRMIPTSIKDWMRLWTAVTDKSSFSANARYESREFASKSWHRITSVLSTVSPLAVITYKWFKGFEALFFFRQHRKHVGGFQDNRRDFTVHPEILCKVAANRSENKNKDKSNNSNEPSKNKTQAAAGVV
jgi:hypothetical protein